MSAWQNPFGPGALNNLLFFHVPNSATLSCPSVGARCSFVRSEYETVEDVGGGALVDQVEGSIWTASSENDSLLLQVCQQTTSPCLAACFVGCTCEEPDGTMCEETTPPPTPSPTLSPTSVVADKVCALSKNTDRCPVVAVKEALRPGQMCDYCWNFCNGQFAGCCSEDGSCFPTGSGMCPTDGTGEPVEEVFGCTQLYETNTTSRSPTLTPTIEPTAFPTALPTEFPTAFPSMAPSLANESFIDGVSPDPTLEPVNTVPPSQLPTSSEDEVILLSMRVALYSAFLVPLVWDLVMG